MEVLFLLLLIVPFTIIICAVVFMFFTYKFINKDKSVVLSPTEFPLLENEDVLFVSQKMRSFMLLMAGRLYDLNGSYVIITNKRLVISAGPSWMKYSLFFSKIFLDSILNNQILVDKFKYNSKIAIFERIEDNKDQMKIISGGLGREFKNLRKLSDFFDRKMLYRLWNFTPDDKKAILRLVDANKENRS